MTSFLTAIVLTGLIITGGEDTTSDEEPPRCEIEEIEGGLTCVDDEGHRVWENPILTRSSAQPRWAETHTTVFYTTRGHRDLLILDRERGVVRQRYRYPAQIHRFEKVNETELEITLYFPHKWAHHTIYDVEKKGLDRTASSIADEFSFTHAVDEPPTAQTSWWTPKYLAGPFFSARAKVFDERIDNIEERLHRHSSQPYTSLGSRIRTSEFELHEKQLLVETLETARNLDPTNAFYPLFLAEVHRAAGNLDKADDAYREATLADAPWQDLFYLSTKLENADRHELAELAYQRGLERFNEAGLKSERLRSEELFCLIFFGVHEFFYTPCDGYFGQIPVNTGLLKSLEEDDVERVDAIMTRYAAIFPNLPGAHQSWTQLSEWMAKRGDDVRAAQWAERADENRQMTHRFLPERQDEPIFRVAMYWATMLVLLIFPLVIGLRIVRRQVEGEGPIKFRAQMLVVLLLIPGFVGSGFAINMDRQPATGHDRWSPDALSGDALASPDLENWIKAIPDPSTRDELMAIHEREHAAFIRGEPISNKKPLHERTVESESMSSRLSAQREILRRGEFPEAERGGHVSLGSTFLCFLSLIAVMLGLGWLLGRLIPFAPRWAEHLIPGCRPTFTPLGPLVLLTFLTGAIGLFIALDRPDVGPLAIYGFPPDWYTPKILHSSMWWAWLTIIAATALHIYAVIREWRGDGDESENSTT